ncbi:MAG: Holliday junction branch migration protein RuvA [Microcoleaceae cyanobacterium]
MISYLIGKVVHIQKSSRDKVTLILDVNNIGYEVQIVPRLLAKLPATGETMQIFTHYHVREDQVSLFGFAQMAERDLFRQLISVSGIGVQLAIALLDTLELPNLVQAIVNSNTKLLAKTPGVGPKTAERIALELKTKLAEWRHTAGLDQVTTIGIQPAIQEEVEITLLALGYTPEEVIKALQAISKKPQ